MNETETPRWSTNHEDVMAKLPQDRQERIKARAWELLAADAESDELPMGRLVAHAVEEYRQGRITNIRDLAKEIDVDLDNE